MESYTNKKFDLLHPYCIPPSSPSHLIFQHAECNTLAFGILKSHYLHRPVHQQSVKH